jgi:hypothetical protein
LIKSIEHPQFGQLFAKVITKRVSLTKEKGYLVVNKMYAQKLFTLLYPVIQKQAPDLMMSLCSTVSLQLLENQNKLNELIPLAEKSLSQSDASKASKTMALSLFRKILIQSAQSDSNEIK